MTLTSRLAIAAIVACVARLAVAADLPREMHGVSDSFATPGIAIAWGVLRSDSSGQALVDVRLAIDPMSYPHVVVVARDPFSSRERVLARSATAGLSDVRMSRATLERYPRTEFRFFATAKPEPAEAPKLVVYFLGVPDTTPEFTSESKLDASLVERIVRAKSSPAAKAP
jgi:hypothetical protein